MPIAGAMFPPLRWRETGPDLVAGAFKSLKQVPDLSYPPPVTPQETSLRPPINSPPVLLLFK